MSTTKSGIGAIISAKESDYMTFKELRIASGMSQRLFAEYFGIPKRTVENWEAGVNKCPDYLLNLMKYKLDNENEG